MSGYCIEKGRDIDLYYSEANKPIMSSNKNTIDELEEYLKKHYEYDLYKIFQKASSIIMWISATIFFINMLTVNNKITTAISLGINIANFIYLIIYSIVDCHNLNVYLYESFEWLQKRKKERD